MWEPYKVQTAYRDRVYGPYFKGRLVLNKDVEQRHVLHRLKKKNPRRSLNSNGHVPICNHKAKKSSLVNYCSRICT